MSDFIFPITPTSAKQEQLLVHDQQHQQQHFLNTVTWNLPSSSALSTSPTSSASKMEQAYHQITASSPPSVCLDAKSALSFPLKLRHMLEEAEDLGLSHIVSWEMEGTAFRVHNPDEFVHLIMRRWFNQTKYKSFQRQLNLYGFSRITRGQQKGCYLHALFQRDNLELAQGIVRKKVAQDTDAESSLASVWLPNACPLILEPTPIQYQSTISSSSSLPVPNMKGSGSMMDAFENYFQANVMVKPAQEDFKKGDPASANALKRMLDNFIEPDTPTPIDDSSEASSSGRSSLKDASFQSKPGRSSRPAIFPGKLHDMLDYCERMGLEHVASWQMDGRAFKVHDIDQFMELLMPKFFKLTKFESLQRQLNLYSFTRIARGKMKGCYHHPLFVKGGWALSQSMQRRKPEDVVLPVHNASVEPAHVQQCTRPVSTFSGHINGTPDNGSRTLSNLTPVPILPDDDQHQASFMDAAFAQDMGFASSNYFKPEPLSSQMFNGTGGNMLDFGFVPTVFN